VRFLRTLRWIKPRRLAEYWDGGSVNRRYLRIQLACADMPAHLRKYWGKVKRFASLAAPFRRLPDPIDEFRSYPSG
jgi:hypothetical protein